jgi:copper chaperone CopZ
MKCGGCESNVITHLNNLDGIIKVDASSKESKVDVTFDSAKTNLDAILQAIKTAGYMVN